MCVSCPCSRDRRKVCMQTPPPVSDGEGRMLKPRANNMHTGSTIIGSPAVLCPSVLASNSATCTPAALPLSHQQCGVSLSCTPSSARAHVCMFTCLFGCRVGGWTCACVLACACVSVGRKGVRVCMCDSEHSCTACFIVCVRARVCD